MLKYAGEILRMLADEEEPKSVTVLGYVGNIFSLAFFATPLIQIIQAYKTKLDKSDIPLLLLILIILNCLLWLINAFASGNLLNWIPLLVSNGAGILINLCIFFLYLNLILNKKIKQFIFYGIFTLNVVVQIAYFMFRFIILKDKDSKDKSQEQKEFHLIGFVATVINICMYSSTIVNIVKMVRTKRPENLPIFTIGAGLLCTIIFMVQGMVQYNSYKDKDRKLYAIETMISNGVSFLSLTIQGGIWLYYFLSRDKHSMAKEEKEENIDATENLTGNNNNSVDLTE
jgi:hypothetical protein